MILKGLFSDLEDKMEEEGDSMVHCSKWQKENSNHKRTKGHSDHLVSIMGNKRDHLMAV